MLLLTHKPTLIYLDNVEDSNLVNKLPGLLGCCSLLITSRLFSSHNWPYVKELSMLDRASSVKLFSKFYELPISISDIQHVANICNRFGDMPLAIELCAKRAMLSGWPLSRLLSLSLLSLPRFHDRSVESAIDLSYQRLDDDTKCFFVMLGLFEGRTFSFDAVRVMWNNENAFDLFIHLTDCSLLQPLGTGRYVLHPLIHEFAAAKLQQCSGMNEFQDRMITYFLDYTENFRGAPERLDIERENIFAAMKECD
jgi:hypothetical protein